MFKSLAVALLLNLVQPHKIPLQKRELTLENYMAQKENVVHKFLGGEVGEGTKVKVTDFSDAQYFINVDIGTPG